MVNNAPSFLSCKQQVNPCCKNSTNEISNLFTRNSKRPRQSLTKLERAALVREVCGFYQSFLAKVSLDSPLLHWQI